MAKDRHRKTPERRAYNTAHKRKQRLCPAYRAKEAERDRAYAQRRKYMKYLRQERQERARSEAVEAALREARDGSIA